MPQMMGNSDWSEIWDGKIVRFACLVFGFNMWRAYKKFLKFVDLSQNSNVLELGCGTGKNSMKICREYNCSITLVDNCEPILKKSKESFRSKGMVAKFISDDIFNLKLKNNYDLVFSDGVAEHFSGREREKIFKIHKKFAKRNGYVLILVPRSSRLYWLMRRVFEKIKLWKYAEMPFTRKELLELCVRNSLSPVKILKPFFGTWIGVLAKPKH